MDTHMVALILVGRAFIYCMRRYIPTTPAAYCAGHFVRPEQVNELIFFQTQNMPMPMQLCCWRILKFWIIKTLMDSLASIQMKLWPSSKYFFSSNFYLHFIFTRLCQHFGDFFAVDGKVSFIMHRYEASTAGTLQLKSQSIRGRC